GITTADQTSNNNNGSLYGEVSWIASIAPQVPNWLSINPATGIVPTDSSMNIDVAFNAAGLMEGNYVTNILVSSNDPENTMLTVPVHLSVTGAPNIFVDQDTIDFGEIFVNYQDSIILIIENNGSEILNISEIHIDNNVFEISKSSFSINHWSKDTVTITFHPVAIGSYTGTITIYSNDPSESILELIVTGIAVEPPVVGVSPDSLRADLFTNDTIQQYLTINNTGGSKLIYEILPIEISDTKKSRIQKTIDTKNAIRIKLEEWKGIWKNNSTPMPKSLNPDRKDENKGITISKTQPGKSVSYSNTISWRLLYTDPDETYIDNNIQSVFVKQTRDEILFKLETYNARINTYEEVACIIYIDADQDITTGYYTEEYDDYGWFLGADYFIISTSGIYFEDGLYKWDENEEEIVFIEELTTSIIDPDYKEFIYGVNRTYFDEYSAVNVALEFGNIFGYEPDRIPDTGSGHITCYLEPLWLRFSTKDSVIPAGNQEEITVTFDATGLFGGTYAAHIKILSNDPVNSEYTVPAYLYVTGRPFFYMEDDTIDFNISYVGYLDSVYLKLENTGTKDLEITNIVTGDSKLTVTPTSLSIPPLSSDTLILYLLPENEGLFNSILNLNTNDPDTTNISIPVTSTVLQAPDISVLPGEIEFLLDKDSLITDTVTIYNSGGSDLVFEILAGGEIQHYALQFDGLDDYIGLSNPLSDMTELTIQAWVHYMGGNNVGTIFMDATCDGGNDFILDMNSNGIGILADKSGAILSYEDAIAITGLNLGNAWHHVTWTMTSSESKIYIDGCLKTTKNESGSNIGYHAANPSIGRWWDECYHFKYFNGLIDELRIWNTAIEHIEIQSNMRKELTGAENGLIGYWPFNEGSGNITFDQTLHSNHGTLHSGVSWIISTAPLMSSLFSFTPSTGIVPADSSMTIIVTFSATGLQAGNYNETIIISSNDPDESKVIIPLSINVISPVVVKDIPASLQKDFVLHKNYPNPFNKYTIINYEVFQNNLVTIRVFDMYGKEIGILVNERKLAGKYIVPFNAENLPAGIYFFQIRVNNHIDTKKMILIR
ncbi:MAG: choice-of-anchor D domain-containing protein, partial [Bacteroidales bacterium]|nr:choice-of-anchor D domain-containing protein [Bacteroidales bacterium]